MTAIARQQFQESVPFSELEKGTVTVYMPEDESVIEKVTFRKTGIIGGYIGYTIPTEFVECTVKFSSCNWLDVLSRADDAKWVEAVEEAVSLYELMDTEEPTDCDLDALRAEWRAYKENARPYTDAVIDKVSCDRDGLQFVRYFLAYIGKPIEMNTDLEEVTGVFVGLDSEKEGGRMRELINRIYKDGQEN